MLSNDDINLNMKDVPHLVHFSVVIINARSILVLLIQEEINVIADVYIRIKMNKLKFKLFSHFF